MIDRPDPLEDLLASVADGSSVDWDTATRESDPGHRCRVEALVEVSRIAAFNRSLQQGGEPFGWRGGPGDAQPERWGDLLLLERLSVGARAEIYRAWDTRLQREVALKLTRFGGSESPEHATAERILQEGRAAARIRHPNVVSVHGVDTHDGRIGFWMEFLRGETLDREVQAAGPLDPARVLRLGIEIGSGLAAVHDAGLLHRDVKPANIVHDGKDRYVLTDFGLGRNLSGSSPAEGPSGTPMYMAPELFTGGTPSERSDIYALGLTLWFALAGRQPFEADSLEELIERVGRGPGSLRRLVPALPVELESLVMRATARLPEDRFPTASRFLEALETCRVDSGRAQTKSGFAFRRPAVIGGVAAALGVAAIVTILVQGDRRHPPVAGPPRTPASSPVVDLNAPSGAYDVEASFLKHDQQGTIPLLEGDGVKPGDRLSLRLRTSRPAWVYVLNEDEHGEHYLLFPQPRFDVRNPLAPDSTYLLPGGIGGRENAWTVTSPGGREYLLVAVSLQPVPELESELSRIPAAQPGRPIEYAAVGREAVETLRGVGGVSELPADSQRTGSAARTFDRFRALAGREIGVEGIWVRQIVFENPRP